MDISIRHSEPADLQAVKALYAQPSCYAGTLQLPYPSDSLWASRLASDPQKMFSLVAEQNGSLVGQLGLHLTDGARRKHAANLGMAVSETHRNRGIGASLLSAALDLADNWLALRRIELEVYTDNQSAIALYQRHGFEIEGTAREYAFRNGEYVDVYLMARLNR